MGIKFSKQCLEFYEILGYLSFYGNEIFGIDPDDLDILEGDSVAYALNDRREYNLSAKWIPLYNFDDGYMAYLDYSQLNSEGESAIIMAIYNGDEYIITEKVAEDLEDFLLQLVQEQLSTNK